MGCRLLPTPLRGSLNLNVHFHTLAVDGVFEKLTPGVRVHETAPPEKADVLDVARRVHDRVVCWFRKHGYLDDRPPEERSNELPETTPMDAFARISLAGRTFLGRPHAPPSDGSEDSLERRERRFSASHNGFDIHCAVRIAADDDEGRERLIRYCARPPFALDRIEVFKDERITYLMKTARKGSTHRVMTPVEFLARIATLIPPPYYPLLRYHGVFAARSSWRPLVMLKPPPGAPQRKAKACTVGCQTPPLVMPPSSANGSKTPSKDTSAAASEPTRTSHQHPIDLALADPTTMTIKHWRRLLDGELFATSTRIEWAVLIRRTFGVDALRCPTCDRRMRILATITDPLTVRKLLLHLKVRADPLPLAPARDPTGQTDFGFDAA